MVSEGVAMPCTFATGTEIEKTWLDSRDAADVDTSAIGMSTLCEVPFSFLPMAVESTCKRHLTLGRFVDHTYRENIR
jgi:hypothetical protein